jgi:CSLREA domain-containing protein
MKITILTACLLAFLFTFSTPTFAATATVNLTTDEHDANPGDGVCAIAGGGCSLRAAVEENNVFGSMSYINFNLPQYSTITLTAGNGGEILTYNALSISGLGSFYLTIDGGAGTNRIFQLLGQGIVSISDVSLTGGDYDNSGGAIVANQGISLWLRRVHIYGNRSWAGRGGGVAFQGNGGLIKDSTISGNWSNDCGGVNNQSQSGTVEIVNSTISGNTADNSGGGLCNFGDTTLRNVTITNNTSRYANDGTNSTTKGGGGILQEISFYRSSSTLNLGNTIVAGNFGRDGYLNPTEIQFASGIITSAGGNLIGNSAGDSAYTGANAIAYHPTDIRNVNPMLGVALFESSQALFV